MPPSHAAGPAVRADRAVSPAVGVVLLVLVTVVLAATVGVGAAPDLPGDPPPAAHIDCRADAGTDRVACTHRRGDRLDTRDLRVHVAVDGDPLTYQPPVPFFAARGFRAGPTGPFNPSSDPGWTAGETASFDIAATNDPGLTPGASVRVRLLADGYTVAAVETEVE